MRAVRFEVANARNLKCAHVNAWLKHVFWVQGSRSLCMSRGLDVRGCMRKRSQISRLVVLQTDVQAQVTAYNKLCQTVHDACDLWCQTEQTDLVLIASDVCMVLHKAFVVLSLQYLHR